MSFFRLQGLTEDQARECIWTVDSQGLVTADRKNLPEHKKCEFRARTVRVIKTTGMLMGTGCVSCAGLVFARRDYTGPPVKDLVEIIELVKPTALLGLSTQHVSRPLSPRSRSPPDTDNVR